MADRRRRNANLDVFCALLARELPSRPVETGVDIGCGEGETARILHAYGAGAVVGVDPHPLSIDQARRIGGDGITYVQADALDVELSPADVVTSVAMLHHVEMVEGLRAMASLVAPGGLLLVVGLAKGRYPRDFLFDVAGSVAVRFYRPWHTMAPIVWRRTCSSTRRSGMLWSGVLGRSIGTFGDAPWVRLVQRRLRREVPTSSV